MKRDLMEIICCPTCKSDLTLSIEKEDEKEIIKGVLTCTKCGVDYPIEEGIPNLLPKNLE
ncbi:MAG: methytransferase partner Trm112 [Thermoplasmata archaeon]|nr:MAG: methytransferase partner Trm112 [Thermoplasmata archaeon]